MTEFMRLTRNWHLISLNCLLLLLSVHWLTDQDHPSTCWSLLMKRNPLQLLRGLGISRQPCHHLPPWCLKHELCQLCQGIQPLLSRQRQQHQMRIPCPSRTGCLVSSVSLTSDMLSPSLFSSTGCLVALEHFSYFPFCLRIPFCIFVT